MLFKCSFIKILKFTKSYSQNRLSDYLYMDKEAITAFLIKSDQISSCGLPPIITWEMFALISSPVHDKSTVLPAHTWLSELMTWLPKQRWQLRDVFIISLMLPPAIIINRHPREWGRMTDKYKMTNYIIFLCL